MYKALCETDLDCQNMTGKVYRGGNGPATGQCVDDTDSGKRLCEISAWCPTESENKTIT